ncbi:MAG: hypothetical protein HDT43_00465 [Ruminococcaceae bacterium]|nr:hypothetical protein [Oscillospiraceae bacterium]
MKSRITVGVFSVMIAVCSLSIGGCSGNNAETGKDITASNIKQPIYNSDSSSTLENDLSVNSAPTVPSGQPTVFIGADGEPVYDTDVMKITNYYVENFSKTAAEITNEDEGTEIICEGFQYFKEPVNTVYNSYDNPEMFDGYEFNGEMPVNNNPWKRVNVGDEICGLKLKYAVSLFYIGYGDDNDFEERGTYCQFKDPHAYEYAENSALVEFEGTLTLTGFLSSSPRSYYFPDGGYMDFCPIENKLPVMCYDEFLTEPNTCSVMGNSGAACAVGESYIIININKESNVKNQQNIEFVDGMPGIGDTVLARVTLSNITYGYGYYSADFSNVEILSGVLAHEDDEI